MFFSKKIIFFSFFIVFSSYAQEEKIGEGEKLKSGKYTLEKYETESLIDEKVAEKQKQISDIRKKQIEKLKDLLQKPYYENKAEVYFRLAESYWEEGLYQYLLKRKDFEKALDAFEEGTLKEKPIEPQEDYSLSLEYYRKILREYPNYERIDEVMYYLGKGALKEGKTKKDKVLQKEGIDYLVRLVQNYPESRFIEESHLALAEYYFENNSLYYAKTNYEKIVNNYPNSPIFDYALYKLGWVYFNLREFDKTIKIFQSVVDRVTKAKEKRKIEFKDQAINDLIVTYAEIDDGWVHAKEYFLTIMSEEDAYKKLLSLANLYMSQDKDNYAIAMFRHFIEREKNTKNIPDYFKSILEIKQKVNDIEGVEDVTNQILEYFKEKGTWMTVNKDNEAVIKEALALQEKYLAFISTHFHKEAERLKKEELYKKAAHYYSIFLEKFSNSSQAYVINFNYAEILYHEIHDYKKAAEQYNLVIERDKKGEFVEEAALGVIYCYEELMVQAGLRQKAKKGEIETVKVDPKKEEAPIPETPLHELEKGYIAGADKYVEILTDLIKDPEIRKKNPHRGERIPEIMFIAAQVFYQHGKFDEGVKRLKVLFDYDPKHKFAAYAAFTLMDCYKRLNRWTKVEEWARKLIAAKNFTLKKESELKKYVAIAMAENAKQLSTQKKFSDAIEQEMKVYKEFRDNEDMASKALFNTAALFESAKDIDKAISTYRRVVKEFPKCEMAPKALFVIGVIYESQTLFDKAAETFEAMEKFKEAKETPDALQNAGLIREALGEYDKAIKIYQKFVKLFPKHEDTPNVYFRIGLVYETIGNKNAYKNGHEHYLNFVKEYPKQKDYVVEAYARAGALLKQIDKKKYRKEATALFDKALKEFAKIPASEPKMINYAKQYAAQSAFEIAEYVYDDFSEAKIPSTLEIRALKKALLTKAELHQSAEKMYNAVLEFKSGEWTAGALFRIGLLYYEFAQELFNVPIPEGLTPDEEDQYRLALEELASPAEEKSLTAFEHALKLTHEQKVYNKWSKLCGEYAAKVNPDVFPLSKEDEVKSEHIKDTLYSASFIRTVKRGKTEVTFIK